MWTWTDRAGRLVALTEHGEPVGDWGPVRRDRHGRLVLPAAAQRMLVTAMRAAPLVAADGAGFTVWLLPLDTPADGDAGVTRVVASDGFSWREPPLPLLAQWETADGHDGAVVVGRIDTVELVEQDGTVWVVGRGALLDTEDGARAAELVASGAATGVSVDLGGFTDSDITWDDSTGTVILANAVLLAATLVAIPAFGGARIELDTRAGTAAATTPTCTCQADNTGEFVADGDLGLPLADRDRQWDGAAAASRVRDWATGTDGEVNWREYARAFFWHEPDADTAGQFKLGFADIIDGTLTAVPQGIFAVAAVLQGARGGVDIPDEDVEAVKTRVARYYERMRDELDLDVTPPWEREEDEAAALAAADGWAPPADWFTNPNFDRPTPWTVTPDGRVYGHVALWSARHLSSGRRMPRDVAFADRDGRGVLGTRRTVTCADGTEQHVAVVTMRCSHADHTDLDGATRHYELACSVAAMVRVGKDRHGVWVAGALAPHLTDEDRALAAVNVPSVEVHWRDGQPVLVGLLLVPRPGLPVPVAAADRGDRAEFIAAWTAGLRRPAVDRVREELLATRLAKSTC